MYPIELPEFDEVELQVMKSNRLWVGCTASDLATGLQRDVQIVVEALHRLETDGYVFLSNPQQRAYIRGVETKVAEHFVWQFTTEGKRVSQYL